MYLTAVPASYVVDRTIVDVWRPGHRTGYQRKTMPAHIAKISKYIQRSDAIMPVAGILNVRDKDQSSIKFKPSDGSGSISSGVLTIPDEVYPFVIDMQHRKEAFEKASEQQPDLRQFPIPVCIIQGLRPEQEALQFFIINTKSRRVKSDLALRLVVERFHGRDLLELTGEKPWKLKAVKTIISLNKKQRGSPWFGQIKEPNAPRGTRYLATERSFVRSLRPLIEDSRLGSKHPGSIAKMVGEFWNALRAIFPGAFVNPREYRLQKYSTSLIAFHKVMPTLLEKCIPKKGPMPLGPDLRKKLKRRLAPLAKIEEDFWHRTNREGVISYGAGYGAEGRFALFLAEKLGI